MVKLLTRPIDIAILVYFRFFAGIMLGQELINGLLIGKFKEYTAPNFHFTYLFFDWVRPWPLWGMGIHYTVTIVAAFSLAVGLRYRLSALIVFLGYVSLFLMEMGEYNNHFYLYCLLSFWLICLPLGRNELRPKAPAWMLYFILFHMSLAYFFGGVAKINSDWLNGSPMDLFLAARGNNHPWAPLLYSWGGMLFDLLIVPALIWRRTRLGALIVAGFFHLSNVFMFGLATFPWFSFILTTMFFDPSWPRSIPYFNRLLPAEETEELVESRLIPRSLIIGYVMIHLMLPFRHHLYPHPASWSEDGHMFAWRMMLRDKAGTVHFYVMDKRTNVMKIVPTDRYLTKRQSSSMIGKPDMILQFAHFIRDDFKMRGKDVKVFASSRISLNGRPYQEMIKPGTDLTQEERSIGPYHWVRKLEHQRTKSLQGFAPVAFDSL